MISHVIRIAKKAGESILEVSRSGEIQVESKNDPENSPVTPADLEANRVILEELRRISDLPIVSEETCVEYRRRKGWKKFWLVDPLDGTKDFLAGNGEYTVNIALVQDIRPVLGVVYAPALDLAYWAEEGQGAFKNGDSIMNRSVREELVGSDSRFHSTEATLAFFRRHRIRTIKKFGSALKICKLAEGEIDVYPRMNGTMEWDTAAAHIIAREGHCKLVDVVTKQELFYNKRDMRNNHFIACRADLNF